MCSLPLARYTSTLKRKPCPKITSKHNFFPYCLNCTKTHGHGAIHHSRCFSCRLHHKFEYDEVRGRVSNSTCCELAALCDGHVIIANSRSPLPQKLLRLISLFWKQDILVYILEFLLYTPETPLDPDRHISRWTVFACCMGLCSPKAFHERRNGKPSDRYFVFRSREGSIV